ncbi:MAG: PTS sugar transporter subunit IIA [Planctomycetes bacterium]|nr:PTS sugar transporter subunit IIA [Planctomycetota bacterium]
MITDILQADCLRVPLTTSEKTAVIAELVDLLDSKGYFTDRNTVLDAVLAREQTRSTGIGLGLAVPHGKTHACKNLVMAVGKPVLPLDFDSADGRPVNLVVMLVSPADQTGPHIQALAHVSRLWQTESFRRATAQAVSAEELYELIQTHQS